MLFELRRACCLGLLLLALPAWADVPARQRAVELLERLQAGEYPAAVAMFTPQLAAALPAERLQAFWTGLPPLFGAYRERGEAVDEPFRSGFKVRVPLRFGETALVAEIAINGEQRIGSFLVQPQAVPVTFESNERWTESALAVASLAGELPATLTRPVVVAGSAEKGEGGGNPALAPRVPGVVLVHGSGPHDRDETIGPNRPFRDLAQGLAAQGIAVLRYEKRSYAQPPADVEGWTIDDDTTDDAVAAVRLLAAQPGIGPAFVLGHSQGGMLAPRIVARAGAQGLPLAGAVIWAAPARPLGTVLVEQFTRLAGMDGEVNQEEQAQIDRLSTALQRIRRGENPPRSETPLHLPAGFWRSLDAVTPLADASRLRQPLLLLHGGRDYQVVDADWAAWQQAVGKLPTVTLRRYPALNHLGMAGTGPGSLEEYQRRGQVDAALVADVAAWIKAQVKPGRVSGRGKP